MRGFECNVVRLLSLCMWRFQINCLTSLWTLDKVKGLFRKLVLEGLMDRSKRPQSHGKAEKNIIWSESFLVQQLWCCFCTLWDYAPISISCPRKHYSATIWLSSLVVKRVINGVTNKRAHDWMHIAHFLWLLNCSFQDAYSVIWNLEATTLFLLLLF